MPVNSTLKGLEKRSGKMDLAVIAQGSAWRIGRCHVNLSRIQIFGWTVLPLLTACAVQSEVDDLPENPVAGQEQLFVGDTNDAPAGCDIPAVVDHLSKFFGALNQGEVDIAARFFTDGKASWFQWFSFTDRDPGGPGHFETFTPDSLNDYFAARHAAGDKFALRGAKLIGYDRERGTVVFSPVLFDYYVIDPEAKVPVLHYGMGKGGYHCESGRFGGMSLGAKADGAQWSALWGGWNARNGS